MKSGLLSPCSPVASPTSHGGRGWSTAWRTGVGGEGVGGRGFRVWTKPIQRLTIFLPSKSYDTQQSVLSSYLVCVCVYRWACACVCVCVCIRVCYCVCLCMGKYLVFCITCTASKIANHSKWWWWAGGHVQVRVCVCVCVCVCVWICVLLYASVHR